MVVVRGAKDMVVSREVVKSWKCFGLNTVDVRASSVQCRDLECPIWKKRGTRVSGLSGRSPGRCQADCCRVNNANFGFIAN